MEPVTAQGVEDKALLDTMPRVRPPEVLTELL